MYLPLVLEVCNRLLIDCVGLISVDTIKKHLLGFTQSVYSIKTSFLMVRAEMRATLTLNYR